MKNFSLRTLIPVATASALVALGCGGKAVDNPDGTGDGDGDGDAPLGPQPPDSRPPSPSEDPLSDENFPASFDQRLSDYCRNIAGCGSFSGEEECNDFAREQFFRSYDLDRRDCRELILETFDCANDQWSECYDYSVECLGIGEELNDECGYVDSLD